MKLFIDANIYLDYFRVSSEKLSSLEGLKKLLIKKKLTVLVPQQTIEEYIRMRGVIVEETRRELLKQKNFKSIVTPNTKDWKEAEKIKEKVKTVRSAYDSLIKKYDKKIINEQTDADILIKNIFDLSMQLKESKLILEKSYIRYMKGNPPRKSNYSYGDAIIWELLLKNTIKDNLAIVTRDQDFITEQKGEKVLNVFLQKEWGERTNKKINLFTSLGKFINQFEKKIVIKEEIVEEEEKRSQRIEDYFKVSLGETRVLDDPFSSFDLPSSHSYISSFRKIKFCPLCGKNIEKEIEIFNPGVNILAFSSKFVCPYCNGVFDPEKL